MSFCWAMARAPRRVVGSSPATGRSGGKIPLRSKGFSGGGASVACSCCHLARHDSSFSATTFRASSIPSRSGALGSSDLICSSLASLAAAVGKSGLASTDSSSARRRNASVFQSSTAFRSRSASLATFSSASCLERPASLDSKPATSAASSSGMGLSLAKLSRRASIPASSALATWPSISTRSCLAASILACRSSSLFLSAAMSLERLSRRVFRPATRPASSGMGSSPAKRVRRAATPSSSAPAIWPSISSAS